MQYRKTQQNIEAIKRQVAADPDAFRQLQEDQLRAASAQSAQQDGAEESKEPAAAQAEEEKDNAEADADADAAEQQLEEAVKQKREAIDKQ